MVVSPLQQAVTLSEGATFTLDGTEYELWTRVLTGRHPMLALTYLQLEGVLGRTFPEVQAITGFGGLGHKDLWDHTLKVVRQTKNRPALRWAALFHDVGKPVSFSRVHGKVTFHQHEYASARLFLQAARRTRLFKQEDREKIHFLIRGLAFLGHDTADWTDSAVRRLNRELGEHRDDVFLLARADVTSKHAYKRQRIHRLMHDLAGRAKAIAAADAIVPPLPKGLGTAISKAFGVPPSRQLGNIMQALETRCGAGELESHQNIEFYIEYLVGHKATFGV
jgi:poly(A) polymerase